METFDHAKRLGSVGGDGWRRPAGDPSDDAAWNYVWGCEHHGFVQQLERTSRIVNFWWDGQDEPTFAWIVEFSDGGFAFVDGWHDYTGWDCQSGIEFHVAATLDEAMRLAPDDPRRAWEESK